MPNFPIQLLLDKQLKASLLPSQILRTSQHVLASKLATSSMALLDTTLDTVLAALREHTHRDTLLSLPVEELNKLMPTIARVRSSFWIVFVTCLL